MIFINQNIIRIKLKEDGAEFINNLRSSLFSTLKRSSMMNADPELNLDQGDYFHIYSLLEMPVQEEQEEIPFMAGPILSEMKEALENQGFKNFDEFIKSNPTNQSWARLMTDTVVEFQQAKCQSGNLDPLGGQA